MALSERTEVLFSVLPSKAIEVATYTVIERDGVEIMRTPHRVALAPGDSLAGQSDDVVATANALWTADVIAQFNATRGAPGG